MIEQEGIKINTKLIDKSSYIYLINLGGYVDQTNVHILQNAIDEKLNKEQYKLIFDLKDLKYMSSAGWGVLIGEIKRFRESGGDIKLINMGPEVYEIYQMLEFYHIISEYSSLNDATESFTINQESGFMDDQSNNKFGLATKDDEDINHENLKLLGGNNSSEEQKDNDQEFTQPKNENPELIEKEIDLSDDDIQSSIN